MAAARWARAQRASGPTRVLFLHARPARAPPARVRRGMNFPPRRETRSTHPSVARPGTCVLHRRQRRRAALAQLLRRAQRPVRIAQQRAGEEHHVRVARARRSPRPASGSVISPTAPVGTPASARTCAREAAPGSPGRRGSSRPARCRRVEHVDQVDAGVLQQPRRARRRRSTSQPPSAQSVAGDAHEQRRAAPGHGLAHRGDHLEQQAHPVVEAAAVLVGRAGWTAARGTRAAGSRARRGSRPRRSRRRARAGRAAAKASTHARDPVGVERRAASRQAGRTAIGAGRDRSSSRPRPAATAAAAHPGRARCDALRPACASWIAGDRALARARSRRSAPSAAVLLVVPDAGVLRG